MQPSSIVWFRRDLRLSDNLALQHAVEANAPMIPLYIWDPDADKDWPDGAASRYWLYESLQSLSKELEQLGSRLILRKGQALQVISELSTSNGVSGVFWNRVYEPAAIKRDAKIKKHLKAEGMMVKSFNASLLNEPMSLLNKQGQPYKVFTPYWKLCQSLEPPTSATAQISSLPNPTAWPDSEDIHSFALKPKINWFTGIKKNWQPGSSGAQKNLSAFIEDHLTQYPQARDYPDIGGTSSLSPHLHFGEISPRQIWHTIMTNEQELGFLTPRAPAIAYIRQLYWREFAHSLLYHFPKTTDEPLYEKYKHFPWLDDQEKLNAWQRGLTGYPIVDAGMRELWHTGWMHNRVRMIAGSFLVKDLLIHWREGAKWFWDTLVDADLANNTMGWQWIAGCGADAAPFFRIFNPMTQGEKFDTNGDYVRKWIPELAALDKKNIHKPWQASESDLKQCGVTLGKDYPLPIVDHAEARRQALSALKSIKENT